MSFEHCPVCGSPDQWREKLFLITKRYVDTQPRTAEITDLIEELSEFLSLPLKKQP